MSNLTKIRDVSAKYNISARTLRYYEDMGLISSIRTDEYAYRMYDESAVRQLEQVLILRKLNINIKDIKRVFAASGSEAVLEVLGNKVADIDEEVALLHELKEIVLSFIRQIEKSDFSKDDHVKLLYDKAKEIETQLVNGGYAGKPSPVHRLFEVTEKLEEKAASRLLIPDNVLKKRLENVYFIWGDGAAIADELGKKYGLYVYHTCDNRWRYEQDADPQLQPGLSRIVPDTFALTPGEMAQWEGERVRDFTPMVIMDLIQLTANHGKIICENAIDIDSIIPYVSHAVTISNYETLEGYFTQPERKHMLDSIRSCDISQEERDIRIRNLYGMFGFDEHGERTLNREAPRETVQYGVKQIVWDDESAMEQATDEIAEYFGLSM